MCDPDTPLWAICLALLRRSQTLVALPGGGSNADWNRLDLLQGTGFQTVEELIATLDGKGASQVSKAEWLQSAQKCVGLAHTIA